MRGRVWAGECDARGRARFPRPASYVYLEHIRCLATKERGTIPPTGLEGAGRGGAGRAEPGRVRGRGGAPRQCTGGPLRPAPQRAPPPPHTARHAASRRPCLPPRPRPPFSSHSSSAPLFPRPPLIRPRPRGRAWPAPHPRARPRTAPLGPFPLHPRRAPSPARGQCNPRPATPPTPPPPLARGPPPAHLPLPSPRLAGNPGRGQRMTRVFPGVPDGAQPPQPHGTYPRGNREQDRGPRTWEEAGKETAAPGRGAPGEGSQSEPWREGRPAHRRGPAEGGQPEPSWGGRARRGPGGRVEGRPDKKTETRGARETKT